jgi:poly(3-hydroxybutyrate) depolymerase
VNNPFRKAIGAIAVGTIIVGGAYIRQQNGGTNTPPPPPSGLANIFVDQNGGTCTWTGVPLSYVTGGDAKSCSSMDLANKAATTASASSGTVLVENGSYAQQVLLASGRTVTDGTCTIQPTGSHYTEQSNYTGCVTFSPDTNQTPTFDGIAVLTAGVRFVGLTDTNPGTLTTVGTTENIGLQVAWKNTLTGVSCKTVPQPHDVVFDQMHVYVNGGTPTAGAAPLAGVYASGVYNVAVVNSDFGPVYDNPATWQFSDLVQGSSANCASFSPAQLQDRAIYLGHNNLHDFIQDVPANGSGCSTDAAQYNCNHAEGIHWRASNSWVIGNKFINIEQQGISVQTDANDPNIANTAFVGNIFDAPCSNQPSPPCTFIGAATFINNTNGNALTNDIIAFNSLNGAFQVNNDGGTATPFPGTVWAGNITTGYGGNGTSGGCPVLGTIKLNAIIGSASLCGTDFHISGSPYVDVAGQDFTLSGTPDISNLIPATQTFGSVTVLCPALDLALLTRPAAGFSNCAPGAYEPPVTLVSGASLATCTGTCSTGTLPTQPPGTACSPAGTVTTGYHYLGQINNGVANECRYYALDIPTNLNPSPTNKPPAMIIAPGSGSCSNNAEIHTHSRWDDEAAIGRFVVALATYPIASGCPRNGWLHPLIDVPNPGSGQPSDSPYLAAVVADLVNNQNVDPNRIYFTGGSSGGAEAWSIMCDDSINLLFRGVASVSNTMGVLANGAGTSPVNGSERCAPTHHSTFAYLVSGPNDNQASYNPVGLPPTGPPYTHYGSGFDETRRFVAGLLGCNASPTATLVGNTPRNTNYQYGSCGFGVPGDQFVAVNLVNGGHTYLCQDSEVGVIANQCAGVTPNTDGNWDAQRIWNFFASRSWTP